MVAHDFLFRSEITLDTLRNCSCDVSYTKNINNIYKSIELCELYLVRHTRAHWWCACGSVHESSISKLLFIKWYIKDICIGKRIPAIPILAHFLSLRIAALDVLLHCQNFYNAILFFTFGLFIIMNFFTYCFTIFFHLLFLL